ncbi:hypothetical protein ACSV9I_04545 [Rhizobium sp. G187]|uniref:hypothetical protein n=1 Tax=Rhizobium sp. G187 TaxID=3451352 RepID=UPI003EE49F47
MISQNNTIIRGLEAKYEEEFRRIQLSGGGHMLASAADDIATIRKIRDSEADPTLKAKCEALLLNLGADGFVAPSLNSPRSR